MKRFWDKSLLIFSSEVIFFSLLYFISFFALKIINKSLAALQEMTNDSSIQLTELTDAISSINVKIKVTVITAFALVFLAFTLLTSLEIYLWQKKKLQKDYFRYLLKISVPCFVFAFVISDTFVRIFSNLGSINESSLNTFFLQLTVIALVVLLIFYFMQFMFLFLLKQGFISSFKRLLVAIKTIHIFLPLALVLFILLALHVLLYFLFYANLFSIFLISTAIITAFYKIIFLNLAKLRKAI